ncbi:MAG TPA: sulfatase-like hydrolase/transferase [Thermoanaerobaculia bacterium]|jgi:arylsulfatase A-like enzyme/Flp pilus assembly protein TadD|nr:sulfatase-like hydrolase/transferase [Thermoanaerobaculia bacterium]
MRFLLHVPSLAAARAGALAALLTLGAGACSRPDVSAPRPKNLVLVTIDTLRRDHVGAYGDPKAATPALDRLAREGLRFDAATANAPLTLVSHSSLLSGLLPPHHGLRNNGAGTFPADRETLATVLSAAGLKTGAFVAAFVLDRRFGLGRGFDTYDDEVEREVGARPALEAERRGDQVMDRALAWLGGLGGQRSAKGDEAAPFFLWVHLYDPHAPYAPPPPFRERFAGDPYRGEIAFADAQVGRLLDELDRRGLSASTLVAVAADHGEGLGEHGEATHGMLIYESTLAVPLLLRGPGLAPRTIAAPVGLCDLGPTLAGLLGHPFAPPAAGKALDGRDLSEPLREGREPARGEVYAETHYPEIFGWSPLSMLRRRDAKYISAPRPELYDLARDPGERRNLLSADAGKDPRDPRLPSAGFAARLAEIEAGAVKTTAPRVDAETAARLASLGYVAGGNRTAPPRAGDLRPDPKDRIALFQRFEAAALALRSGDAARAISELRALAAADPGNATFRGRLAQALREGGRPAEAIPVLRDAALAAPADPDVWYDLAVALQADGRSKEAQTAIERAIQLDDTRPDPHNTLGLLLLAEGRADEARRQFERAVAIDPRGSVALNNLGNALRSLGRAGEAEGAYRRAIAAAPRYAEPWNGLGALLVEADRPREAIDCFDRSRELAPGNLETLINRGIALELAGDRSGAAASYRDFLSAAGGAPAWADQRRAAEQLLARLAR